MRESFHLNLIPVDARKLFIDGLAGVTDPEKKRKIIGKLFIDGSTNTPTASKMPSTWCKARSTPELIESVSVKGPSAVIKSHHNVGGLPERMKLKLIEPLRELFKDEVRAVGAALGMPHDVLWRHPFPAPGLAVRCLGDLSNERLDVLRKADAIVDESYAPRASTPRLASLRRTPARAQCGRDGRRPHLRRNLRDPRVQSSDGMTAIGHACRTRCWPK